jgi:hypothetical protein
MAVSEEERQFFRRLTLIRNSTTIAGGFLMGWFLPHREQVVSWIVFFGLAICWGGLVQELVQLLGFPFWNRRFGRKHE